MKNFIIVLFSFLLVIRSGAIQAQSIFYSRAQPFSFQNSDFSVVGRSGDFIYTYSASREGYFLNAYNDSMRLLARINLDFFPQKIYDTKLISYADQLLVLYQAVQSGEVVQYAARLDDRGLLQGKPLVLDRAKTSWFSSGKNYYSYAVSGDKSKIMILGVGKSKDALTTILLDDQLNILARSNHAFSKSNDENFHQAFLTDSGQLFLTTYAEKGSRNYSDEMSVFSLSADGKNITHAALPLKGIYLSGLYSKLNLNNNELYSAAFYSDRKSGNLKGILYAVFNPNNGAFSVVKQIPFSTKLIAGVDEKNKKKAFNDFDVRRIILKNDGGFLLIAENAYVTTRSNYAPGYGYYSWYYNAPYTTSTREYHFGDILAINFDPDGNALWHSFIRKEQYSQEDEGLFSSFALLNTGGSLAFLFNDFSARKSFLNLAILDPQGELQISKLNAGNSGSGDWLPRSAKQTGSEELIVPVLNRNNLSFARVAFD